MDELIPNNSLGNIASWSLAIAIAIAIHLGFFLSVKSPETVVEAKEIVQQGVTINLQQLAPPPAPPKPKVIAKPKPEPVVKPKPKPKPVVKPKPKPKPIIKPTPIIEPKEVIEPEPTPQLEMIEEQAVEEPVVETQQIETETLATQSLETTSSESETSDNIFVQTPVANIGNPDVHASYKSTLSNWLAKFKRYPNSAKRRGQQDTIEIEFTIDKDGNVLSYQLLNESKYLSLNKAVIQMIKRASPLPPVPVELQGNQTAFNYSVPVEFELR